LDPPKDAVVIAASAGDLKIFAEDPPDILLPGPTLWMDD
jgi:hypothetical protein